jgi:hypothetical protein
MADEPENLVLAYLRRIDDSVRGLRGDVQELDVQELKVRQNDIHTAALAVRRDQVQDTAIVAHVQAQLDRLRDEIDRINRRLDLHDA